MMSSPTARTLALHQEIACLRDGRPRVLRQLIIRSTADRMADDDELVLRHAGDTAHERGRAPVC